MNAVNQYVDISKNWFDFQLKTGQNWFETIKGLNRFDPNLFWIKTVEASQQSIQGSLDAEVAGARILFEDVTSVNELPQPVVDLFNQMYTITDKVTEAQQTFADNWFKLLKQVDFNQSPLALI
ncbi:MAG: hypothetical protein H6631_01665 [Anaerolineaceae bacterium]|nr:hypothetical protein [Anaerolineaceae bacterium]MCB9101710.1 hypothetical protein [Anaerolineales bacterium]